MTDEIDLWSDPAESALIAAATRHADALTAVLADLPGRDFYRMPRGVVWDAMRALHADGHPIDPVTVARHLMANEQWSAAAQHGDVKQVVQREMLGYGSELSVALAGRYAAQVKDLARRRALVNAAVRLRQLAVAHAGESSEVLARMRAELDDLDESGTRTAGRFPDGPLSWEDLIAEFEDFHAPGTQAPGINSPWPELDEIIGGLHGGRMYTFGGRPAAGKTTAALIVAMDAAAIGKQSLVISKEMSRVDVTGRLLARGAEVPVADINARRIQDWSWASIREFTKRKREDPPLITVDATPRTLAGVKALARTHHHRYGLEVLVVDYLQLVRTDTPGRTREQEVAEVSRQLKELALELNLVCLLPAQLNRGSVQRADPRPVMSDLRDSGQIEQDSDVVILLYRPLNAAGEPTGQIEFIVDKNRHGPTGTVSLRWHGGYADIG